MLKTVCHIGGKTYTFEQDVQHYILDTNFISGFHVYTSSV